MAELGYHYMLYNILLYFLNKIFGNEIIYE